MSRHTLSFVNHAKGLIRMFKLFFSLFVNVPFIFLDILTTYLFYKKNNLGVTLLRWSYTRKLV
jgi:hypothetical protein